MNSVRVTPTPAELNLPLSSRFRTPFLEIRFVDSLKQSANGYDRDINKSIVSIVYKRHRVNAEFAWDSYRSGFNLTDEAIAEIAALESLNGTFSRTGGSIKLNVRKASLFAEKFAEILAKSDSWVGSGEVAMPPVSVTLIDSPVVDVRTILYGKIIDCIRGGKKVGEQIVVDCPRCRTTHVHGWPKGSIAGKPQHRSAHCIDEPRHRNGYMIAPTPEKK